jgi:hypothetical protein
MKGLGMILFLFGNLGILIGTLRKLNFTNRELYWNIFYVSVAISGVILIIISILTKNSN